jgi:hypothetical protein
MASRALAATVLVLMSAVSCQGDRPQARPGERTDEFLSVSFPSIRLDPNERIVGLEIIVTHGHVKAIDNIPSDWSMYLEVDPPWQSRVSGAAHHGAGALTSSSQLDSLIVISPWPDETHGVEMRASLHTTVDFEQTRTRSFTMNDLVLKKQRRRLP